MPAQSLTLAAFVAVALYTPNMAGADAVHCLGKEQQRAAIAGGKAVAPAVALDATIAQAPHCGHSKRPHSCERRPRAKERLKLPLR